mmetsp:Transcript_42590/g.81355  ORF Transcript_42590/g.81355 Transcript_42590/m.81355 type:complete len:484 (+) Transcript_42590:167-1618(+)
MRDKEEHTLSLAQPVVPALGLASSMDTVFSTRNPDTTTESMASQLSDAESGSSAKTSTSGEDSAFDVDSGDDEDDRAAAAEVGSRAFPAIPRLSLGLQAAIPTLNLGTSSSSALRSAPTASAAACATSHSVSPYKLPLNEEGAPDHPHVSLLSEHTAPSLGLSISAPVRSGGHSSSESPMAGSSGGAERPSVDVGSSGDSKSTTAGGLAPSLGLSLGGLPPRGGRSDEAAKAGKKDSLSKPLAGDGAVGAASSVVLDMVTSAFQVALPATSSADTAQAGREMMEVVRTRCSQGLGIVPEDIQLFELRPLPPEEASLAVARGSHIGFRVKRSGLTLAAMEQLLEEHARVSTNLDKCTAALEGMREEVKSQNIAATSARAALYAEESQTRQWQDSCATLEAEVVTLRKQLQRADELRMRSQQSLDELKGEFEALTKASPSFQQGPPAATSPGNLRALDVLERLCADDISGKLEKLEHILQMVPNK